MNSNSEYIHASIDLCDANGDADAWLRLVIPLEPHVEPTARFRASDASKEIIAKELIQILMKWVPDEERANLCK